MRGINVLRVLAAQMLLCGQAVAAVPGIPPGAPTVLPPSTPDIGAPVGRPFGLDCDGQSNAFGSDFAGPKTVNQTGGGIWVNNAVTGATTLVQAAFGSTPFNVTTGGAITSDPAQAYNNQCIWFANKLRASGRIPASRPIVIIFNAHPAQAIVNWVGAGTASVNFVTWLNNLAVATAAYPGFKIDFSIWDQGENDSGSQGANTQALYTTAFQTLMAQKRAVPQWSLGANGDAFDTNTAMVELARFTDNNAQARNDAIDSFADGALDPHITMVPTFAATETTISANLGPHYNGVSLAGIIADRDLQAWVHGSLNGGYKAGSQTITGGSFMPVDRRYLTSGTLTLTPDDCKSPLLITATAGALVLPPPQYCGNPHIELYAGAGVTVQYSGGIQPENTSTFVVASSLSGGVYQLQSANDQWRLVTESPRVGGFQFFSPVYSTAAQGLTQNNANGTIALVSGSTVSLPPIVSGGLIGFYGSPTGTASTLGLGVATITPTTAGSGYAVGDLVTLSGGTPVNTANAVGIVRTLTGSGIGIIQVSNQGVYSAVPTTATQGSTTGAGTGAVFNTTSTPAIRLLGNKSAVSMTINVGQLVLFRGDANATPAVWVQMLDTFGGALPNFTVAALPACGTVNKGALATVTDATSPTYNAALTGGGAVAVPAFCNGTAWTSH